MRIENEYNTEFKWPVAVDRRMNTSADKVWDVISMPGHLDSVIPFVKRTL